jgi:hypothetical protein
VLNSKSLTEGQLPQDLKLIAANNLAAAP